MRAARYYGIEDIRVEEIEEPVCKEGQIKIKPAFVGICGTGEQVTMSETTSCSSFPNTHNHLRPP
jgi:threonine dehydrogenase-like Zn-dependent dehydrogenase